MKVRVNLEVVNAVGDTVMNRQLYELLQGVDETGSINAARQKVGLSYKRAWDIISDLNHAINGQVTHSDIGGVDGGGTVLTSIGQELVLAYKQVLESTNVDALEEVVRKVEKV